MSPGYRMSDDMQFFTLIIAAFVAYFIWLGIRALVGHYQRNTVAMDIEDFADDFLTDRDQHADDIRDAMQGKRT